MCRNPRGPSSSISRLTDLGSLLEFKSMTTRKAQGHCAGIPSRTAERKIESALAARAPPSTKVRHWPDRYALLIRFAPSSLSHTIVLHRVALLPAAVLFTSATPASLRWHKLRIMTAGDTQRPLVDRPTMASLGLDTAQPIGTRRHHQWAYTAALSRIALFDGGASTVFDVLPSSASR